MHAAAGEAVLQHVEELLRRFDVLGRGSVRGAETLPVERRQGAHRMLRRVLVGDAAHDGQRAPIRAAATFHASCKGRAEALHTDVRSVVVFPPPPLRRSVVGTGDHTWNHEGHDLGEAFALPLRDQLRARVYLQISVALQRAFAQRCRVRACLRALVSAHRVRPEIIQAALARPSSISGRGVLLSEESHAQFFSLPSIARGLHGLRLGVSQGLED
jgi:hypothetical protein